MPVYDRVCADGHQSLDVYVPKVTNDIPCRTCGAETQLLTRAAALKPVTWPGGQTFENLGDKPVTFYSPAEKYAYMKKVGAQEFVRHASKADTDKSSFTTNWVAIGPETLANAKAMLERVGTAGKETAPSWVQSMTVTVSDVTESVRGRL